MPLRRRLALVAAAAVAVAIVMVAIASYVVVRGQLRSQVDDALRAQEIAVQNGQFHALDQEFPGIPPNAGGPAQYVQIVGGDGSALKRPHDVSLPVDSRTLSVASGHGGAFLTDIHVRGSHLRELTFPISVAVGDPSATVQTVAVELARPLDGVDHVLSTLRLILLLLCAGGVALAAALGRLAARRVLVPLAEVAQTAQEIGETDDLSRRIAVRADDEVGQLATRFNGMLERLESSRAAVDESVRAQRQLVADASHELRTPVTSLRTNIEVLLEGGELSDDDRQRLLRDVVEQSEELSALVADLIELARGDQPIDSSEDVRLDRVVAESVARGRRNAPSIVFESTTVPVVVEGVPERIGRAVNNLIDNASLHSPDGGTVDVRVEPDGVTVRDHGPGIPAEDLPYVFDRFFRGQNARSRQGSGLGLAIVRQVAEQHGGSITAENASDGGAVFKLRLPGIRPDWDAVPAEAAGDADERVVAPLDAR